MKQVHGIALVFVMLSGAALLGCAGDPGPAGPAGTTGKDGSPGTNGDKGDPAPGTPSISALTPTSAYLARTLDVTISGSGTAWAAKATADFGDKITVNKVTVASDSGIVANITVAADAALGPRDVTVKDDAGGTETFKGAFNLASPLKFAVEGTVAQGSIALVHTRGLDFQTPFDTTSMSPDPLSAPVFTNLAIGAPKGVGAQIGNVTDYVIDYTMLLDVNASTGTEDAEILSGPKGDQVDFPAPAAYKIAQRAPKAVTAGTTEAATIKNAYDTNLYSYTPASAFNFVKVVASSKDKNASTKFALLPKSGSFADLLDYGPKRTFGTLTTDPYYAIYFDNSGYSGYDANLDVTALVAAAGGGETEPNNSPVGSNPAAKLPYVIVGATLADPDPKVMDYPLADWYTVNVTAADVAAQKKIHILTGGDRYTDTVVDILMADGVTPFGTPSDDLDYHEDLLSDPVPSAGVYYVRVYDSSVFDPAHASYDAYIALE